MTTHNPDNERIERAYFAFLKEAKRYSEPTLDGVAKAMNRFETYTRFRSFKAFHIEQAIAFKRALAEQHSSRTGEPLSKATLYSTLIALRNFFQWLAGQPGFRSKLTYADAEYFNLSEKETRIAKAVREQRVATIEQIKHVIATMPADTQIDRRDRALIAFTLLTGARDSAIASMRLKHLDLNEGLIVQDAREVKTKFSKTFSTSFFPVGDEVRKVVEDWVRYLRAECLWGEDDPIFPATRIVLGPGQAFQAVGMERAHWQTASPIRRIFREAFGRAGLPYFNPHSFRKTLALYGEQVCRSPEEFKAWSQNLGHEGVMTTFISYGQVSAQRQREILRCFNQQREAPAAEIHDLIVKLGRATGLARAL